MFAYNRQKCHMEMCANASHTSHELHFPCNLLQKVQTHNGGEKRRKEQQAWQARTKKNIHMYI